jgi:hypothetical protein
MCYDSPEWEINRKTRGRESRQYEHRRKRRIVDRHLNFESSYLFRKVASISLSSSPFEMQKIVREKAACSLGSRNL